MMMMMMMYNLISKNHWAFNKGRSTEELLLQLTEKWKDTMDMALMVGVIFLDLQKSCDSASHDILGQILQAVDISNDLQVSILSNLHRESNKLKSVVYHKK